MKPIDSRMRDGTAALARSITWAGSKQTYLIARLMVDKELRDDFFRAYAYFRWADDIIDTPTPRSDDERIRFVERQRELIDRLYRHERPGDLTPEEEIVADLISHDKDANSGLQSFIRNMLSVIEFDAFRKGRLVSQNELNVYTHRLGKSVTDGLLYFIGNEHAYPGTETRYLAATGAHIAHMLRDMCQDIADGFINIPREYLEEHGIGLEKMNAPPIKAWVRNQVEMARGFFGEGKHYLDKLDVLRCKIVGYWYCARFEGVLDAIQSEGYVLRAEYNERHKLSTWLKIIRLSISVTLRHILRKIK